MESPKRRSARKASPAATTKTAGAANTTTVATTSKDIQPGQGWSNGSIDPQLFASTQDGRTQLYSSQRRWIGLSSGWTRIGGGGTEMDARHSSSASAGAALIQNAQEEAVAVRALIAQLCETFYKAGWATGTGGGVCIRTGGPSQNQTRPWRVFVAPSGIQKEDMIGDDIFELDMDRNVVVPPKTAGLRQSACTPLWYTVFANRPSACAVIHTHSQAAQMATLMAGDDCHVLRITHLEMLKGVGNHAYDDVLEIPIIDNRPTEDLLAEQLEAALQKYPKTNAVLVRRHGIYVWGDSWEQAKTQCESFDYLCESALKMKQMGLDAGIIPVTGTYRVQDAAVSNNKRESSNGNAGAHDETARKRLKTTTDNKGSSSGFHGSAAVNNDADCVSNVVPVLPRNAKHLVLDVEGCTTAISFVKETMFPYILKHLDEYLNKMNEDAPENVDDLCQNLMVEVDAHGGKGTTETVTENVTSTAAAGKSLPECAAALVKYLMASDVKSTALKGLQGKMFQAAFTSGDLVGHVYSDCLAMLQWMHSKDVQVYIYSSGSVQAQKLLFGHSLQGDLLPLLSGHFDIPAVGNKKEANSYRKIAAELGVEPSSIVFVSDAEAELVAAKEAGIGWPVMSIRPGNEPLTAVGKDFPTVYSLLQLCGED
jgi:methylthioribulose 1-phosphate dehydratase/enolase-phosphatase E1